MADSLKMMLRSAEGETYQSVVDLEQVVIDKQLTEVSILVFVVFFYTST